MGLPGPSGTPGDGSLRSEKTLTIYKGDKVTRQGKRIGAKNVAPRTHVHKNTHACPDVMGFVKKKNKGRGAVIAANFTALEGT